jgi:hypothetical protein
MRRTFAISLLLASCVLAGSVAGLKWIDPSGWTNEGSRPMRAATYSVPPAPGDREKSECVVYFFGTGQGGDVEANILRWKGQVLGSDGKPAAAKVKKQTIHSLPVTTIDSSGEYTGMGGPMSQQKSAAPGYRLLGAVIEGPEGNVFIKFAGPAKTVAANETKFQHLLNSFEKAK